MFWLLTLNIFHTFLKCFYYWLWASKCVHRHSIAQKVEFFIKGYFSSHLLKKSLWKTSFFVQCSILGHKLNLSSDLTYFWPVVSFYTPRKHQKIKGFLGVFRGYETGTLARNGLRYPAWTESTSKFDFFIMKKYNVRDKTWL